MILFTLHTLTSSNLSLLPDEWGNLTNGLFILATRASIRIWDVMKQMRLACWLLHRAQAGG